MYACQNCDAGHCKKHGGQMKTEFVAAAALCMMMKGMMKGGGKGKGKGWINMPKMPGEKIVPTEDKTGEPGPNGEDPESGRWTFESRGQGMAPRWRWRKIDPVKEAERARKRALYEAEEAAGKRPKTGATPS
eukprot:TRINITY_DN3129_c2_g1_i1.p1 TRINITY_DN3129_c2_g1~~TRINITY_DN3129_c2_g1_i1.p1  ORF type:complete len:132 (-),score=25.61 TRINITY_DN3129_c2_g1_i1:189-584(-)